MKKHEKEIERVLLEHEKDVLKELAKTYERALSDIQKHTKQLHEQINKLVEADVENKTLIQSKIYQLNYQKALKKQINGYLDVLKSEHVKSVKDYMKVMYEDSYLTNIYNLQKYGIPVTVPINQELMIKSLTYDINKIPLSKRLYDNVDDVKKKVVSEISRGISTGMSYQDIARNIKFTIDVSNRKANMIAQNEGQRVKTDARIDSMRAAKKKGADIVKVWDATLDNKTRPVHQELDQKRAEIEEKFKFSGGEVFAPKQFGIPSLDINCRCVLLSVPRWDLEDTVQKRDNVTGELIEAKNYADWKEKYYNKVVNNGTLDEPIKSDDPIYDKLLNELAKKNVKYIPVQEQVSKLTSEEIINVLAGGDMTSGSCASLGLAYIGQKQGWDVLDYRGGDSQEFFSSALNLFNLSKAKGLKTLTAEGKTSITVGNRLLKQCEVGKEYYLCVGRHAAIVRKLDDGTLQYLELQSSFKNGWTNFDGNPKYTLNRRFGCGTYQTYGDFMIDIAESDFSNDDFKSLLGYINTAESEQRKGKYGTIK